MLSALIGLIGSYLEARAIKQVSGEVGAYLDRWARLVASILITTFVTFTMGWGGTTGALLASSQNCWLALVAGFAAGLFLTGAIVYQLWTRSDLTKGIPIALPSKFVEPALEQNIVITQRS